MQSLQLRSGFRTTLVVTGVVALAMLTPLPAKSSEQADGVAAPIYGIQIPRGYRDWTLISVASVGPPVNDTRAKLGNDVAVSAYRQGKVPFPDGTIIARLAYQQAASEEGNEAVRREATARGLGPDAVQKLLAGSFVAGPATTVQFMVKNSKKYASTAGWGFAEFTNGKPSNEAEHNTCFACHAPAKDHDYVFTRYAQ
jgi:cytochrome P460